MEFDRIHEWLGRIDCARSTRDNPGGHDSPDGPIPPTPPSISILLPIKREYTLWTIDPSKRQRRGVDETESASAASSRILPLHNDITLSPSASIASHSHRRSPSPARHKTILATSAAPRVLYLHELDDPCNDVAKSLREFLAESNDWEPAVQKIQEAFSGSWKCATQQWSESCWVTEVTRSMLQAAIEDLPLEAWGVQTESVGTEYQPRYTARDRCNRKIDYVVGFPKDHWEELYMKVANKFPNGYVNHVDHSHTGTHVLGLGSEIKPKYGNLIEAEVQLGVWMAGFFSWAFRHRTGSEIPPPMVGYISVGESWEIYIVHGVAEETIIDGTQKLGEVRVWGPLSELAGRTSNNRTCLALAKTLRQVMVYLCGEYIDQLQKAVISG
ncbi:hypothetical protein ASPCADRAFT_402518 [Aspergillus carbonarius ITEM 5010]|uniref:PD-(D/E)XK nuclease-like domain-containing protein n=1 Tax=Aspergillus carbonarius (strain ITEM 5010) TaxID=602072 RepID=A0A1R3RZJ5_ASPC5|nr:hypothetical protein ASPCADRAFT_402518 [Aspergillus carbonarius ITEM 5010]